jgi:hypothetical protein
MSEGQRLGQPDMAGELQGVRLGTPSQQSRRQALRRARLTPGDILAVSLDDLAEKDAVFATNHPAFFTIQHFDNYPAVRIQLEKAPRKALRGAIVDAWLSHAPRAARRAVPHVEPHPRRAAGARSLSLTGRSSRYCDPIDMTDHVLGVLSLRCAPVGVWPRHILGPWMLLSHRLARRPRRSMTSSRG